MKSFAEWRDFVVVLIHIGNFPDAVLALDHLHHHVLCEVVVAPLHLSILRISVSRRHRGGRMQKINAWYLNTHMVYL
jgi:hypothetical protein